MERARAVVPGFAPAGDDLACVAEIVRRLDGLPLAIELAAARLHTHSLGEVAAGLDRRFSLLAAGHRRAPRHASPGAVVSWSFDQLLDPMRHPYAPPSSFPGPFAWTAPPSPSPPAPHTAAA